MFMGMIPDGLFVRKNKFTQNECAQRCTSALTITLPGCTIKIDFRPITREHTVASFQTYVAANRMFKAGQRSACL